MPPVEDTSTTTPAGAATSADSQQSAQQSNSGTSETPSSSAGATGTPAGSSQGSPAGASGDQAGAEKPKSALDAVLKVLKKPDGAAADKAAAPAGTATEPPVDEKEHQAAGEGEKEWISREEYAKLPPVVRRRIGRLTSERNEARDTVKEQEPKATAYNDLSKYCREHRLNADDFTFGLAIMAEIRAGSPAKAWEMLQPVIRDLQGHVGEILPADLAKEVEDGSISKERAQELAAARRESQRLKSQGEERTVEQQRADAERRATEQHGKVTTAIRSWEEGWKAKDPDYKLKAERVWERMMALMQGKELTPDTAVQIAEQAKKDVEGWLAGVLPKPKEVRPGPQSGTGASTNKKPSSSLEAARLALRATA